MSLYTVLILAIDKLRRLAKLYGRFITLMFIMEIKRKNK